jgi:hypothetical protein
VAPGCPTGGRYTCCRPTTPPPGSSFAQLTITAKTNEIPAFTPLLDQVKAILGSLDGVVIVADALHAQATHATDLHTRGPYLIVTIKANQPTLHQQLKTLPWAQISLGHRSSDRGHGRRETRTLKAVTVATPKGLHFPHAAQAIRITRTRTQKNKTTRETAYLIATLPAERFDLPQLGRGQVAADGHVDLS